MPTRFAVPHRGMRWHPIPIFPAAQHPYIVQQILWREFQAARGGSGLQVFKCKASSPHYLCSKDEPSDNRIRIRRRKVSSPREAERGPIHVVTVSLNSVAPEDEDGRAICHERAIGTPLENCCQFAPINSARVTFKFCLRGRPHLPRRMRYVIFDTPTTSLSRITPVVFGADSFRLRPSAADFDGKHTQAVNAFDHSAVHGNRGIRGFAFRLVPIAAAATLIDGDRILVNVFPAETRPVRRLEARSRWRRTPSWRKAPRSP
jgi:hypothetical protein